MGWAKNSPIRQITNTVGGAALAGQNITIGAASVASAAFQANTQMIQISAVGGNCHVTVATAPTALATDMLIKATDVPLLIRVAGGEKIAVIQDGASTGTLNIVEVTH